MKDTIKQLEKVNALLKAKGCENFRASYESDTILGNVIHVQFGGFGIHAFEKFLYDLNEIDYKLNYFEAKKDDKYGAVIDATLIPLGDFTITDSEELADYIENVQRFISENPDIEFNLRERYDGKFIFEGEYKRNIVVLTKDGFPFPEVDIIKTIVVKRYLPVNLVLPIKLSELVSYIDEYDYHSRFLRFEE